MANEATPRSSVSATLDGAIRIGLFVGAVVLVLGFKLFQAWLAAEKQANAESAEQS